MGFDATTDIEQHIQEVIQEVLNPLHEASDIVPQDIYTRRFQALCSANASLCNKIIFAGQVSEYNKFVYLALMVNVVAKTDRFLLA